MNHRIYLFPFSRFMWERCVSAQQTRAGRHPKSTACTHTSTDTAVNSMHLCKLVHTNDHMSLFKRSDAQAWIQRERVRSVVSLVLVWSLSLSLSLCCFFFMSWCCRMSFLCGRHPPTHLCPSGPSGPESIWHLPLCLSSCHLRRPPPTALMRRQVYSESTHTHTQCLWIQWPQLQLKALCTFTKIHNRLIRRLLN